MVAICRLGRVGGRQVVYQSEDERSQAERLRASRVLIESRDEVRNNRGRLFGRLEDDREVEGRLIN